MSDPQSGELSYIDEQLDLDQIKKRSISGALAFVGRTFFLQGIGIVAFLALSIFLTTAELGIFFVVDATVSFLVYFSDVGLAAALIQKKAKLTHDDLATTFTIQQILVIILVVLAFLLADRVGEFYEYGPQALLLFKALVISFFLSSLKTIPSILLERELDFNKLVIPQILENLVFYGAAVYFAWQGYGVTSYTYAVLGRAVIGLIAIYALKPWKPIFGISRKVAKSLVSFGAPFQANSIMALFKDKALIIFLGKVLEPSQIGYLGWAEKWALSPIRFFADPVLRVTFPAYSRLQDQKQELKKAIEKSIFFVSILVFPSVAGLIAIAPSLVTHIPKYAKWQPALIALTLYSINTLFSSISITLTNTLNATGKVKTTLKLMVMWTTLTWVLTPILISFLGYNGAALASALTAASSMVAFYIIRKIVNVNLVSQLLVPSAASLALYLVVSQAAPIFATSLTRTFVLIAIGALLYLSLLLIFARQRVLKEFAIVKKYIKRH